MGYFYRMRLITFLNIMFLLSGFISVWSPESGLFGPGPVYADTYVVQYGPDGSYGENGGDLDLTDVAWGSEDYLDLYQAAYGGKGGYGDAVSPPGRGGHASSYLNSIWLGNYSTSYGVYARGGEGGYGDNVSGALAGNAYAGLSISSVLELTGSAAARGGNGGSGGLYGGQGDGGRGGHALASISMNSMAWGWSHIAAYGGNGGLARSGFGGQGGNAKAISQARDFDGYAFSDARALGGSGGDVIDSFGHRAGAGGNAETEITFIESIKYPQGNLNAAATGGRGGSIVSGTGDGGQGGEAIATLRSVGGEFAGIHGPMVAEAVGGSGGAARAGYGGQGGAANATIEAIDTFWRAYGKAESRGGAGGDVFESNGHRAGDGGTARVISTGRFEQSIFKGYGSSIAAYGGQGGNIRDGSGLGGRGGDAEARASFYCLDVDGELKISASAYGGDGGQSRGSYAGGDGGNATAMVTGVFGQGDPYPALINAFAQGGRGGASTQGGYGRSGQASALAGGSKAMRGKLSAQALTPWSDQSNEDQYIEAKATAFFGMHGLAAAKTKVAHSLSDLAEAQSLAAAAFGTALPLRDHLTPLLTANSTVQGLFTNNSVILGYGVLGVSINEVYWFIPEDCQTASLRYHLKTDLNNKTDKLTVGFLDAVGASGITNLSFTIYDNIHAQTLFTQTFTNGAQALSFFEDRIFTLGAMDNLLGENHLLDISFNLFLETSNLSAFACNFIFGYEKVHPVPLPSGILLSAVSLLRLITRISRQKYFN